MKVKRWKRCKCKRFIARKGRAKLRITIIHDDLGGAKQPPEWMRELLFQEPESKDKLAG